MVEVRGGTDGGLVPVAPADAGGAVGVVVMAVSSFRGRVAVEIAVLVAPAAFLNQAVVLSTAAMSGVGGSCCAEVDDRSSGVDFSSTATAGLPDDEAEPVVGAAEAVAADGPAPEPTGFGADAVP
ncbi:hypothetical protein CPE01_13990 [Cellulomonas persica]|uniref:Uncharacterized protein n=1 Tax=Cellulomonas persica TaxID=76861 RepID=A0A510UT49_9CELL|nr:hypothetical protein CPE01_13990 [Cellulomonas persica]